MSMAQSAPKAAFAWVDRLAKSRVTRFLASSVPRYFSLFIPGLCTDVLRFRWSQKCWLGNKLLLLTDKAQPLFLRE